MDVALEEALGHVEGLWPDGLRQRVREPRLFPDDGVGEGRVGLSPERPLAEEQLERDDAEGPPVDGISVAALGEDLGGHVGHRAGDRGERASLGEVDRDVEVGQVSMTSLIEQDVVRLEVPVMDVSLFPKVSSGDGPMDDAFGVEVLEREGHLGDVETDDVLFHEAQPVEMEAEVAAEHEVEDHEQVLVVLEGIAQVADEGRVDLLEQAALLDDVGDGALLCYPLLVDVLERVQGLGLLVLDDSDLDLARVSPDARHRSRDAGAPCRRLPSPRT